MPGSSEARPEPSAPARPAPHAMSSIGLSLRLALFLIGLLAGQTGVTLMLVAAIFSRTSPGIDADLAWKTQRGAAELARALDFGMAAGDRDALLAAMGDYRTGGDVVAIIVTDPEGRTLATHGDPPPGLDPFGGRAGEVARAPRAYSAWATGAIEGREVGKVALVVSAARLSQFDALRRSALATVLLASVAASGGSLLFVRGYLGPLLDLTERTLAELAALNADLEERVRRRTAALEASLSTVRQMQKKLVVASHQAGRAEVATTVLHNVGNALNSVNVASAVIAQTVRESKLADLQRALALVEQHRDKLGEFVASDRRGRALPAFLSAAGAALGREHEAVLDELRELQAHIDHIKVVIATQLDHARAHVGAIERVTLGAIVDDAVKLNRFGLDNNRIALVREDADLPEIFVDTNSLLQILMNLLSNARHAVCAEGVQTRSITIRTMPAGEERVALEVEDTGIGIPAENLTRIFQHGFTTKPDGHGFGLHGSANAAAAMGGTLGGYSDGDGRGARFRLELPLRRELESTIEAEPELHSERARGRTAPAEAS